MKVFFCVDIKEKMVVNPYQKKWSELTEEQKARRREAAHRSAKKRHDRLVALAEEGDEDATLILESEKQRKKDYYNQNRQKRLEYGKNYYMTKVKIVDFPVEHK